jgi:hypothetical protein
MLARPNGQFDCMRAKAQVLRNETVVENYCRNVLPDVQRLANEAAQAPKPAPGTAPSCRRVRDVYCKAMKLDPAYGSACQAAQADVAAAEGPTATPGDLRAKEHTCGLMLPTVMSTTRAHFIKMGITPP